MKKTNKGLVEWCKSQLNHPYWYGCFGQISSEELYKSKKKQYPNQYQWKCKNNQFGVKPSKQLGVRVFDCIGLIKGFLWWNGTKYDYNGFQDVSANEMRKRCETGGTISTMPEVPGLLVFLPGHVGVYIGNGKVIEARGHKFGVVQTDMKNREWLWWGYCPYIEYVKEAKPTKPTKPTKTENKYFVKYPGKSNSLVDSLKACKIKSDYNYRKKIAKANGIKFYTGTAKQNIKLLNLLKKGKLIKPKG